MTINEPFVYATEDLETIFGATDQLAHPHTELNGKTIRVHGGNITYFVLDGKKCFIPDLQTYNGIFANASGIIEIAASEIVKIEDGVAFEREAFIVKASGIATWYLLHNKKKCPILNQKVVKYCNFTTPRPEVPKVIVDAIPDGVLIDYGNA